MHPALSDTGQFLAPYLPKDPLMLAPWLGAFQAVLHDADALAAFRQATGTTWHPATTPLDAMIDAATGAEQAFFTQFAQWFNTYIWGEDCL